MVTTSEIRTLILDVIEDEFDTLNFDNVSVRAQGKRIVVTQPNGPTIVILVSESKEAITHRILDNE